jgi:hypothetical protein
MVSNVAVTPSVIFSSPILRGAPGRGSSLRPSIRLTPNRRRHAATVTRVVPKRLAMARLAMPLAASSYGRGAHRFAARGLSSPRQRFEFVISATGH